MFGNFSKTLGQSSTSGGGLFGNRIASTATTTTAGSSIFGSVSAPVVIPHGTTTKFDPVTQSEMVKKGNTNVKQNLKYMSVCFMKCYETKSTEELRFEDYEDGRKTNASATTTDKLMPTLTFSGGSGLFGASVGSSTPTTTSSTGIFGSTFGSTASPFTSSNLFKTNTPAIATATSSAQPSSGLFGSGVKPSIFGSSTATPATTTSATSSLFGSTTFGSNTTAAKPFGSTGFGSTNTATTSSSSLFGSSNTGSLFGATNAISTPAKPASSGLFGSFGTTAATTTTSSIFGSTFGTTTTTTAPSLFGSTFGTSTVSKPTLFGQSTSTGLFGATTTTLATTAATTAATTSSLFGSTATKPSLFGSSTPTATVSLFSSPATQVSTPTAATASLIQSSKSAQEIARQMLHEVNALPYRAMYENKHFHEIQRELKDAGERSKAPQKVRIPSSSFGVSPHSALRKPIDLYLKPQTNTAKSTRTTEIDQSPIMRPIAPNFRKLILDPFVVNQYDRTTAYDDGEYEDTGVEIISKISLNPSGRKHFVICTRPDYYIDPPIQELRLDQSTGRCVVRDFTVHCRGNGSIRWPGITDITDMNIDEIVDIGPREVTVYPDSNERPKQGQGLNKEAFVTLLRVFPMDPTTDEIIEDPDTIAKLRFPEYVKAQTLAMPAEFIDYDRRRGTWVFKVFHF